MEQFRQILQKYWGYSDFRPLQDKIIQSLSAGNDTLGLMPTGGGKSITFQVPAMDKEGVCIVITPLIALMKDQVENLRRRHIKATAIYSGMTAHEIDCAFDNCLYGNYKFLYISPERIGTERFRNALRDMKVSYLVVDESHCISQWGYDFRPAYLRIAEIRDSIPDVPTLAVTATATPEVVEDIQVQLKFRKKNVFQKSFERNNLRYFVKSTENKNEYLLKILKRVSGCAIVYVRSRKKTKEISDFLNQNGIKSEFFHAGLTPDAKDKKQSDWKNDVCRVMVSTNAFGMGIDKPDVRLVVHIDLPESLEAYFQEAGRAGRDEQKSYAILLHSKSDIKTLRKRFTDSFPSRDYILSVYQSLGSFLQVAIETGEGRMLDFDLNKFCTLYHYSLSQAYNALKILEQAGYIELTEEEELPARFIFCMSREEMYHLQISKKQENVLEFLLRKFTGTFSDYAYFKEEDICKTTNLSREEVYQVMLSLSRLGILHYVPSKKTPLIIYTRNREPIKYVKIPRSVYEDRMSRYEKRMNSVIQYAENNHICRSRILLNYFGEKNAPNCGVCDICHSSTTSPSTDEFSQIKEKVLQQIREGNNSPSTLVDALSNTEEEKILLSIRFLIDNNIIRYTDDFKLEIV